MSIEEFYKLSNKLLFERYNKLNKIEEIKEKYDPNFREKIQYYMRLSTEEEKRNLKLLWKRNLEIEED
jgi:hypothetical protein